MGIDLHFALPKNTQVKIAEPTFASLSRVADDRPKFKGAHAGHAPGTSPSGDVVPVPINRAGAVYDREIERHNTEAGRCAQGARGRSYAQMFEAGLAGRTARRPTDRVFAQHWSFWSWIAGGHAMSEHKQELLYLFCIPMRAWENDGLQPVLEI